MIFLQDRKRIENINEYREMWAKEVWLVEQLWEYVPKEIQLKVLIDLEVNETDPDFSFYQAVFAEEPEPIKPLSALKSLSVRSHEHSSTG